MKNSPVLFPWSPILVTGILFALSVDRSAATDGTITRANASTVYWDLSTNWLDGQIADGIGATAWINAANTGGTRAIELATARTLGVANVVYNRAASGTLAYTLQGQALTFDNDNNGAQLNLTLGTNVTGGSATVALPLLLNDSLSLNNGASLNLTLSGAVSAALDASGTKALSNDGSGSGTTTVSGIIGDGGSQVAVRQNSATSALVLSGANTYTGATIINAGVLKASALANLGDSAGEAISIDGGTLEFTASVNSSTYTKEISIGASGGTLKATGFINWYGALTGSGVLYKTGINTLSLNNASNTLSGGIYVQEGKLRARSDGALGALGNSVTIADGATFLIQDAFDADASRGLILEAGNAALDIQKDIAWQGVVSGAGNLVKTGDGTLTLANTATGASTVNTYTGDTVIQAGAVKVTADSNLGDSSSAVILDGGKLQVSTIGGNNTGIVTDRELILQADSALQADKFVNWNGVVSGSGALNKQGNSTLSLNNASNTFVGDITVSAGVLRIRGGDGSLGATSNGLFLEDDATFRVHGSPSTLITIINAGRNTTLSLGTATLDILTTTVWNGAIGGSGGMVKTGTAALAVGGAIGYSGETVVSAGALLINGGFSAAGGAITVEADAQLGGTSTIDRAVLVETGGALMGGDSSVGSLLSVNADVILSDGSYIALALGSGGAHSTLARAGGNWTFDLDQAFYFLGENIEAGTYANILTGMDLSQEIVNSWTIANPELSGSFVYDAGNVSLVLVPEPSMWLLTGLGATVVLLSIRRTRRA